LEAIKVYNFSKIFLEETIAYPLLAGAPPLSYTLEENI
jgi:hypothetical protein